MRDSWYYLGKVGQVGFVVIVPIVVGAFVGQYIGKPLAGILIGLVLGLASFAKVVLDIIHLKN